MPKPVQRKVFEQQRKEQNSMDTRIENLETSEFSILKMVHATSLTLNGQAINAGTTHETGNLRGTNSIPNNAAGVIATFYIDNPGGNAECFFSSGDDTPDATSQQYLWRGDGVRTQLVFIPLGSNGTLKIAATTNNVTAYLLIVGYWV